MNIFYINFSKVIRIKLNISNNEQYNLKSYK